MCADVMTGIRPAVVETALAGRRIDAADVRALAGPTDILAMGGLADDLRRRRHGAAATFVRVHVFAVDSAAEWTAPPAGAREVRLVGRTKTASEAVELTARAKALAGDVVLRGFVLGDLVALGAPALFADLAAAGLDEVATVEPGHGMAAAVEQARTAGLAVRVIGAVAGPEDRAGWLLDVRALADAVGGFEAVAPLAVAVDLSTPTTGYDDVRQVALARLALETIARVQVDWPRHGPKLAQVALTVGADDLDAVAADDDASRGVRRAPLEEVRRNIASAGFLPAERDGRFAPVAG